MKCNVLNINWTKWWVLCKWWDLEMKCMLRIALSYFNARTQQPNKKNKVCSIQKFDIQSRMDWLNCVVKQEKTHNPNNSSKKEAPTTNVGTNIRSLDRWRRRRRKLFAMKRVLCVAKVLLDILLDTKNLKHHISRCYKYDSSSIEFERFGIYFENCENIICEHWNRTKKLRKHNPPQ